MLEPAASTDRNLPEPLTDLLGDAARSLADEPTVQETLDGVVHHARTMIVGCSGAAITLSRAGRLSTPAATDAGPRLGDQWQYDLHQGPCVDAIQTEELVWSIDIGSDARWPQWGAKVANELGVRSMLCFQLYTSESTYGALNLYSTELDAFSVEDRALGGTFAAVAAAAIRSAETEEQLHSAIASRMLIGQAQGILIERFRLSPTRAFAVLSRISQTTNVKLVTVADEIVRTGVIPGTPD